MRICHTRCCWLWHEWSPPRLSCSLMEVRVQTQTSLRTRSTAKIWSPAGPPIPTCQLPHASSPILLWPSRKDVAEGPGDATVSGEMDRTDADIAAAREARYIAAFGQRRKISILLHQPVTSTRVMADVMKLISCYRSMV